MKNNWLKNRSKGTFNLGNMIYAEITVDLPYTCSFTGTMPSAFGTYLLGKTLTRGQKNIIWVDEKHIEFEGQTYELKFRPRLKFLQGGGEKFMFSIENYG